MARRRTPEPTASPARGAVLVVVAVVVGLFLLRNGLDTSETVRASDDRSEQDSSPTDSTESPGTTAPAPVVRPPAEVPVVVLNGTKVTGAAGRWSEALGARGYPMGKPGDAEPDVSATQVFFVPGYEAEAAVLVEALGSPAGVAPVAVPATPPGEIGSAQVVVVLGPDLASSEPPAAG